MCKRGFPAGEKFDHNYTTAVEQAKKTADRDSITGPRAPVIAAVVALIIAIIVGTAIGPNSSSSAHSAPTVQTK